MTRTLEKILTKHQEDINKINDQRRMWLWASSVIFTGIILLVFTWEWLDHFHSRGVWWLVISLMLIISINWWYWTMRVVRILLNHQTDARSLLVEIVGEISEVKKDIKDLATQDVDSTV